MIEAGLNRRVSTVLLGCLCCLQGCDQEPRDLESPKAADKTETDARADQNHKISTSPFIAVNELEDGLIPTAPQIGDLAIRSDCLVFRIRKQLATPLWPAGTSLKAVEGSVVVTVPYGESYVVPSQVTLPGAFVPLNSRNMTKFSKRLANGCPNAVFAIGKQ